MKVKISTDELWPYFELAGVGNYSGQECEVPDDVIERWKRVLADFSAMQNEMKQYIKP